MVQIRLFGKNSGESLRLVDLLRSEMQAQLRIRSSSEPRDVTASKETSDYQGPGRRSISEDSGKRLSAGPPTRKYSLSCGSIHRETHVTKRRKGESNNATEGPSEIVASSSTLPIVSLVPNRWDASLMSTTLGQPFADALPTGETPKIPRDDPILEGCMKMKRVSAEQVGVFVDSDGPARAGALEFVTDESLIAEQRKGITSRYGGQIARVLVEKDYLRVHIPSANIYI